MKAIMISIKPKWCAQIMNGKKTIEVRKNKALASAIQKLIDENGYADIYVYCSKNNKGQLHYSKEYGAFYDTYKGCEHYSKNGDLNGKVVFKFRCYKVDEWDIWQEDLEKKLKPTCLSFREFDDYSKGQVAYAIHISKIKIFGEPKELSKFKRCQLLWNCEPHNCDTCRHLLALTKAPQNFCYVEVE